MTQRTSRPKDWFCATTFAEGVVAQLVAIETTRRAGHRARCRTAVLRHARLVLGVRGYHQAYIAQVLRDCADLASLEISADDTDPDQDAA